MVDLAEEQEGRGDGPHLGCLGGAAIDGWVWDGAGGHTGKEMQAVGALRVVQPPYAPELNPVERFFRELRGRSRDASIRTCRPSRRLGSPSCKPGRRTRSE